MNLFDPAHTGLVVHIMCPRSGQRTDAEGQLADQGMVQATFQVPLADQMALVEDKAAAQEWEVCSLCGERLACVSHPWLLARFHGIPQCGCKSKDACLVWA